MVESSPKGVDNNVGKGEISRYEQFLLFPQCFQRLVQQTDKNKGLFEKGLKATKLEFRSRALTLYRTIPKFKDHENYSSEKEII